ncbi:putative cytochrome bd menaquinol oxidase subunit II [Geobacillus sp. BCO2]|nr:putative cytochrome bd menaquinol oxidase subunit II [Geobacillus sp. BCO2]
MKQETGKLSPVSARRVDHGALSLLMTGGMMLTMRYEAKWLYDKMMEYWPWLIGSVAMFAAAGIALSLPSSRHPHVRGRPRLAVIAIVIQYFLASYAYGKAHLPIWCIRMSRSSRPLPIRIHFGRCLLLHRGLSHFVSRLRLFLAFVYAR